jgi:hypothetical protein
MLGPLGGWRQSVSETGNDKGGAAPGPGRRRTRPRDSLFLSATIQRVGEEEGKIVRVRNLSASGLMAEYGAPLVVDEKVAVAIGGLGTIAGRVAWARQGRIGITFDKEIDPLKARRPIGKRALPLERQRPA